jgi:ATP-binding cassette subfamily C protein
LSNFPKKLKWLHRYTRPIVPSTIFIIILGLISSSLNIYKALIMKKLVDNATSVLISNMIQCLVVLGGAIIINMLIESLVTVLSTLNHNKMSNFIEKSIYTHTLDKRWLEISKYHSGDISTRILSDTESITSMVINTIPSLLSNSALVLGSFITLMYINMRLAIIVVLLSPILIIVTRLYSIRLKKLYAFLQKTESKYRSLLNESIQNIVILKSFCTEEKAITTFTNIQEEKLKIIKNQNKINIINNSLFATTSWLTFFIVFTWGAFNLSNGNATYGTITAILQLFNNIQYPLFAIASLIPKAIATTASIERLMEIEELSCDLKRNAVSFIDNIGVEINNVSFGYKMNSPVLNCINANISAGETVAIIGPSGHGKTTLIRLLLSLTYPQKGHIYLTSNSEKFEVTPSCRRLISYVPQGNTLFSGSIAENLRYGNEDATEEELESVTSVTCAWDFIKDLEDNFNTIIGERGIGLSEGQAQRLAIARALLKKAPILILDEATSSLDMDTELRILQTIKNLDYRPTCLIITHRPSTLAICNRILKLEKGNIYEVTGIINEETAAETI